MDPEKRFVEAAGERWRRLGEELKADVMEFNERHDTAAYSEDDGNRYRISNSESGLEIELVADFGARVVRYRYRAMGSLSAGTPEGGMLSIRQSPRGAVEFYSADERLTSEETRQVLLAPILFPPQSAA